MTISIDNLFPVNHIYLPKNYGSKELIACKDLNTDLIYLCSTRFNCSILVSYELIGRLDELLKFESWFNRQNEKIEKCRQKMARKGAVKVVSDWKDTLPLTVGDFIEHLANALIRYDRKNKDKTWRTHYALAHELKVKNELWYQFEDIHKSSDHGRLKKLAIEIGLAFNLEYVPAAKKVIRDIGEYIENGKRPKLIKVD